MTQVTSPSTPSGSTAATREMVDPRAPRFGQSITALGLALGIVLREPLFVFVITGILVVSAASRWRLDLYGFLWKRILRRFFGSPDELEAAAPHRFSKLLGAIFTGVASGLLLIGGATGISLVVIAGYGIAGVVTLLAVLAAAFDFCVGCRMYRQLAFFQRLGWV